MKISSAQYKIFQQENPLLISQLNKALAPLFKPQPDLTITSLHGTSRQKANKILGTNFKVRNGKNGGTFGKGVYFTPIPKMARYFGEVLLEAQLNIKKSASIEYSNISKYHDLYYKIRTEIEKITGKKSSTTGILPKLITDFYKSKGFRAIYIPDDITPFWQTFSGCPMQQWLMLHPRDIKNVKLSAIQLDGKLKVIK